MRALFPVALLRFPYRLSRNIADLVATIECTQESINRYPIAICNELLRRVASGEASPADLNVARQMLKDNQVDQVALAGTPILRLAQQLPFDNQEDLRTGT